MSGMIGFQTLFLSPILDDRSKLHSCSLSQPQSLDISYYTADACGESNLQNSILPNTSNVFRIPAGEFHRANKRQDDGEDSNRVRHSWDVEQRQLGYDHYTGWVMHHRPFSDGDISARKLAGKRLRDVIGNVPQPVAKVCGQFGSFKLASS